jgi:hypothetical protein
VNKKPGRLQSKKNFDMLAMGVIAATANEPKDQKFFGFAAGQAFFQKRTACFLD